MSRNSTAHIVRAFSGLPTAVRSGILWAKDQTSYLLLGTLAAYDGNLWASASAGVFVDVFSAVLFGLLCFSGVGCIITLISDKKGSLKEKILAVFSVRLVTFALSLPGIVIGLTLGGVNLNVTKYIAAAVVFTVGLGVSDRFRLPSAELTFKGKKLTLTAPLLVLLASSAVLLPTEILLSHSIVKTQNMGLSASTLESSLVGVAVAVAAALTIELCAAMSSRAIDRFADEKLLRLNGWLNLTLISLAIAGVLPITSSQILMVFVAGLMLATIKHKTWESRRRARAAPIPEQGSSFLADQAGCSSKVEQAAVVTSRSFTPIMVGPEQKPLGWGFDSPRPDLTWAAWRQNRWM